MSENLSKGWFPTNSGIGAGRRGDFRMPANLPDNVPLYRVLNEKGWFGPDDTLHPEGSVIAWDGGLNEHLEPLNAAAAERMSEYLTHLNRMAELKAHIEGRPFIGRAGDLGEFAAEEWAKRPKYEPTMPSHNPDAAIRPDMLSAAKKRDMYSKRASKLLGVQEPSHGRPGDQGQGVVNVLGSTYTGDAQKDAR